ncbi:unnamed protein product [Sphenostylis stenocarpa]|uniref:non-specific serine/threonine protein kinase n=1 Tax=Sphenostylis stenocarpa TaxID=92480 RepID=A0AA86W665_9FABA|nr:unnamed protein product [Sphenostylis stenocarpa]
MTRTFSLRDHLAVNQSIQASETLVSAGGIVEMGFFSPRNSTRRYLGLWYRNVSPFSVVWVANRNTPLESNSGVLKLNEKGILVLLNGANKTIWSSNISDTAVSNPIAQLLDSGNLIVKSGWETNNENFLWQSFDHLCDTFLAGMKLGWNLETGLERFLLSWKSVDDPSEGEYSMKIDLRGFPQAVILDGFEIKIRVGSWNGQSWAGYPVSSPGSSQTFVFNEKEVYYEFGHVDSSVYTVLTMNPLGASQRIFWTTQTRTRQVISSGEEDQCENYAFCGANAVCSYDGNHPSCECVKGYVPKNPQYWNLSVWSDGCAPRNKSNCKNSSTYGFLKYTDMKLPDTSSSWFSRTMNLEDCQKQCLENCSCVACANLDVRGGGSGCLLWFNSLVDLRKFSQWGQDLYIKVPTSELDYVAAEARRRNVKKKIVGITVGATIFGIIITCVCILIIKNPGAARKFYIKHYKNIQTMEVMDLPTFDFSVLSNATRNFSTENKLGEGGFGPVYKATLVDGRELAVKRLSKMSGQGLDEFKNEVALIAKLQHRNLVKLLGCCIEGEEKMLIYEYMPNQSLDYFVFGRALTIYSNFTWQSSYVFLFMINEIMETATAMLITCLYLTR